MLADIRDVLIISTPASVPAMRALLGTGAHLGMNITYAVQDEPNGIAEAFLIGADHIGGENTALILGDNIFHGTEFPELIRAARENLDGATLFGYPVSDPERYGIGELDQRGNLVSIEEKPKRPRSDHAITGLYFYDPDVVEIARGLAPSARGELEITDVNNVYLDAGRVRLVQLGRGVTWLDVGTHESLLEASQYVHVLENRQGVRVACLEEIALRMEFISAADCFSLGERMTSSRYGRYVMTVARSVA
jgi:glucose-1-phosphate thymidylyltransferase